jgi:DNA gyrase inhibitor GyrI
MVREMRNVKDVSATAALAELDKTQGPINGDQLAEAIRKGTEDADGKGATDEFKQFADWAKKNESRLSPEAKQVMAIYEKHAKAAQAQGQSGMARSDFDSMVKEMNNVKDAGATRELARLSATPGRVSGREMMNAIRRGVGDFDGKSATDEFKQFADWAKANPSKLSPAAKRVMDVYEKYAKAAQAQGQSGIALQDYRRMLREMSHAARPPLALLARSIAG